MAQEAEDFDWSKYKQVNSGEFDWSKYNKVGSKETGWEKVAADMSGGAKKILPALGGAAKGLFDAFIDQATKRQQRMNDPLKQEDPFRGGKSLIAATDRGVSGLLNIPGNIRDYMAETFPEHFGESPSWRFPESIVPHSDFDFEALHGAPSLAEQNPTEQLMGALMQRVPAALATMGNPYLTEGLTNIGANENPVTGVGAVGFLHGVTKTPQMYEAGKNIGQKAVTKTGQAAESVSNLGKKAISKVTEPYKKYKELERQQGDLMSQADAGKASANALSDYGSQLQRAYEDAQRPVDQLTGQRENLDVQKLQVDKNLYSSKQNLSNLENMISNAFEGFSDKPPGEMQATAVDALSKVGSDARGYGSKMYEDFKAGYGAQPMKNAMTAQEFNAAYEFPGDTMSPTTWDMVSNAVSHAKNNSPVVSANIDLVKQLRDEAFQMRKNANSPDIPYGKKQQLVKQAQALEELQKDIQKRVSDSLPKEGREQHATMNQFWNDYVRPFQDLSVLKKAIRKGELSTPSILQTLDAKGARELKQALMENPEFMKGIAPYEWSKVNVENPTKVIEALEGDLGKALPEAQKSKLKRYIGDWETEGKMIDSIKHTLKENGFAKSEIDLKIRDLKKEVEKVQLAQKYIEDAQKSTSKNVEQAEKGAEKAQKEMSDIKGKRNEVIMKIIGAKWLLGILF